MIISKTDKASARSDRRNLSASPEDGSLQSPSIRTGVSDTTLTLERIEL